jgi:hypothetical protein
LVHAAVEGATKPIVDRWVTKGARAEDHEISSVVPFLAFAYTRVPRNAEPNKEVAKAMGMEPVRYWLEHPEALASTVASFKADVLHHERCAGLRVRTGK